MVTIPAPSWGGNWFYEADFTAGGISNGTTLVAHNSSFVETLNAGRLTYSTADSAFRAATASTDIEYQYTGLPGRPADVETVMLVRSPGWGTDWVVPTVRCGTGDFNQSYMPYYSSGSWKIHDWGVDADLTPTAATPDPANNEDWWIRFRIAGSAIKLRAWLDGTSEPGTWTLELTDTSSTTGDPGIGVLFSADSGPVLLKAFATAGDGYTSSSIEQAAFRWGEDDANEAAHTFTAAQNTAITAPTGSKLLRFLVQATADPAATAWDLQHQIDGAGGYTDTPVGSGTSPSLSTIGAGTVVYSAAGTPNSISPSYPSGVTSTDALVLIIGQKPSTANSGSVTTPSGWTSQGSLTGAGGYGSTLGADTGNTNVFVFSKDTVTGTESGALSITLSTSDVAWAVIIRVPAGAAATWSYAVGTGSDTTNGTAVSIATGAMAIAAGDLVIAGMVVPTDITTPSQFSAEALAQTGTTFGTVTEITEPDSGTNNDIGGFLVWAPVSSGSGSGAVTLTATAGGTTTNVRGPGFVLRLRATGISNSVYVAPSANITAGGEATTQRLTGGTGSFTTGRRWDDENGTDTIDIGSNGNTELEWSVALAGLSDGQFVDFRLSPVNTYTVTPRWTVGTPATGSPPRRRRPFSHMIVR